VPEHEIDDLMRLAQVVEWPFLDRFAELDGMASALRVDEIVHCAGCVDYFDKKRLRIANVDLTCRLLEAARRWGVQRFVYLSTAFCGGYRTDLIPERLHPEPAPADEPTEYTRSKRAAEWCIADSGVPFLIVRPSVVIGDSRSGKYTGKNYGLYQMWRAIEGLLCREYSPIWHTVAPRSAVDFIHQDAFQTAFMGIYRNISPDSIVHLVGSPANRPTMRDLCLLWAEVYWPLEIRSYASVDDVPLRSIPRRQRQFLELAAKNFEIASRAWTFETTSMDGLRAAGLRFPDATLESIARCQRRYIEGSPRIQEHSRKYSGRPGGTPLFVEMPPNGISGLPTSRAPVNTPEKWVLPVTDIPAPFGLTTCNLKTIFNLYLLHGITALLFEAGAGPSLTAGRQA
jgi:nucleoside-diphosphate-sugar epimerase